MDSREKSSTEMIISILTITHMEKSSMLIVFFPEGLISFPDFVIISGIRRITGLEHKSISFYDWLFAHSTWYL